MWLKIHFIIPKVALEFWSAAAEVHDGGNLAAFSWCNNMFLLEPHVSPHQSMSSS